MKLLLFFCAIIFVSVSSLCLAQTYDESSYVEGTQTVSLLKAKYSKQEITDMLRNSEMSRNSSNNKKFGFALTDKTSKKLLVCNEEVPAILFEIIEILKKDIAVLQNRLTTAGIP